MKPGEIWSADIRGVVGREQAGSRPVVILADTPTNICLIIPCTSNPKALRFPHTIQIEPSRDNGLALTSIALVFQIRAIDKARLEHRMGRCDEPNYQNIRAMLATLLQMKV